MRVFGLVGKTLKHSFSKGYFTQKFEKEKITGCSYENFELENIEAFPGLIATTRDLQGLNVTIPYKEAVLPFLHEKNKVVEKVGACNCISIREGKLHGYNTDALAFKNSIEKKLRPHHKCALVLGTGGASKAVQYALTELGIDFLLVSRYKKTNELGYEDIGPEQIAAHQIIVNTTPLGMFPNVNDDPPLPYEALTPKHLLYDLIYNPEKTKFLSNGERKGAQILNGYEMLVAQAEASWMIWNGSGE